MNLKIETLEPASSSTENSQPCEFNESIKGIIASLTYNRRRMAAHVVFY